MSAPSGTTRPGQRRQDGMPSGATSKPIEGSTEQVVSHVRGLIERGELRPGDRLPAERDLAVLIGVSRPTVRAGLRALAAMGVVKSRHGSGTYIPEGPPTLGSEPLSFLAALHGFTREEMYEARRILEVGAAGLAAERASAEQVATMAEEVASLFASMDDPQGFLRHDIGFHRAVATASGNPIVASLVEMVSALYYERRRQTAERATDRNLHDAAEAHRRDLPGDPIPRPQGRTRRDERASPPGQCLPGGRGQGGRGRASVRASRQRRRRGQRTRDVPSARDAERRVVVRARRRELITWLALKHCARPRGRFPRRDRARGMGHGADDVRSQAGRAGGRTRATCSTSSRARSRRTKGSSCCCAPLTAHNAAALRRHLSWLTPRPARPADLGRHGRPARPRDPGARARDAGGGPRHRADLRAAVHPRDDAHEPHAAAGHGRRDVGRVRGGLARAWSAPTPIT